MAKKVKKIKQLNQRSYLARDTSSLRSDLIQYANTYFGKSMTDFSPNSLGGLLVDLAAYVGDTMSFYLDHQFNEIFLPDAIETQNIEDLIRLTGTKIQGATPANAEVDFYVEVPAIRVNSSYVPNTVTLPIILQGTIVSSNTGVRFELGEDLDFSTPGVRRVVRTKDTSGNPLTYTLVMRGLCKSGLTQTESFPIPNTFKSFRTVVLRSANVNEIVSVKDAQGNEYHEVDSLTQDVVFKRFLNTEADSNLSPENIELLPAPYRYTSSLSRKTGKTTLRFGGGSADTFDNDIIPDPSEVAIPLFGSKQTFSKFTIDPNSMLKTRTLGISPQNTTLTVKYRAGGGLSHNVGANQITAIKTLKMRFNVATSTGTKNSVRASLEVNNPSSAYGGESPPTLDELKLIALANQNSQSRIVTKEDLLARIYMMPPNFGRVFRAGIRKNPNNPLAAMVSIISRNASGHLVFSNSTLKRNLRTYINEFRLITDALDIVDARIINLGVEYSITVDATANKNLVLQKINNVLKEYLKVENFQIEQPIVLSDLINIIINTDGVISLVNFEIIGRNGVIDGRIYSTEGMSISFQTDRGVLYAPPGAIFEFKFPENDIIGNCR